MFADEDCFEYAVGTLGSKVYVRFNEEVTEPFSKHVDVNYLSLEDRGTTIGMQLGVLHNGTFWYLKNQIQLPIEAGSVVEINQYSSDVKELDDPLIFE